MKGQICRLSYMSLCHIRSVPKLWPQEGNKVKLKLKILKPIFSGPKSPNDKVSVLSSGLSNSKDPVKNIWAAGLFGLFGHFLCSKWLSCHWLSDGQRDILMLAFFKPVAAVQTGQPSRYFGQAHFWRPQTYVLDFLGGVINDLLDCWYSIISPNLSTH